MKRISRNRYLYPDEVLRIGRHFAHLACRKNVTGVFNSAIAPSAVMTGMIDGEPLACKVEDDHYKILARLMPDAYQNYRRWRDPSGIRGLMFALELLIKAKEKML